MLKLIPFAFLIACATTESSGPGPTPIYDPCTGDEIGSIDTSLREVRLDGMSYQFDSEDERPPQSQPEDLCHVQSFIPQRCFLTPDPSCTGCCTNLFECTMWCNLK